MTCSLLLMTTVTMLIMVTMVTVLVMLTMLTTTAPQGEVVVGEADCKCNWGLFRDRNVTLRKPLKVTPRSPSSSFH